VAGKMPWREVCKFLSGAFFVSAGTLFYLWLLDIPVPVGSLIVPPSVHGARSLIHFLLFTLTFYVGYVRTPRR
jgi:hypothetical protein